MESVICWGLWAQKLGNQWCILVWVACTQLVLTYLLGKVLPTEKKNQDIGCECGRFKRLVRKEEATAPVFPAPVVKALLAHVLPGVWGRCSPAALGKGTHWGHDAHRGQTSLAGNMNQATQYIFISGKILLIGTLLSVYPTAVKQGSFSNVIHLITRNKTKKPTLKTNQKTPWSSSLHRALDQSLYDIRMT